MIDKIFEELEKLNKAENIFSKELINAVSFGEVKDAYLFRVYECEPIVLNKDGRFEENYFDVIAYLTEMKNRMMVGEQRHDASRYNKDWLTFRKFYNVRKAWFYLHIKDTENLIEVRDLLTDIYGKLNYHTVISFYNASNADYHEHARIVMEYIGNTRAIRALSMKYLDPIYGTQWQFHLETLFAHSIVEQYGHIFYLGKELDSLEYCPYKYKAKEYYYGNFYGQLYANIIKDVPGNSDITDEEKRSIRCSILQEMEDAVCDLSRLHTPLDDDDDDDDGYGYDFSIDEDDDFSIDEDDALYWLLDEDYDEDSDENSDND